MLVLTRRLGQSLRIGDAVEIQVVRVEVDRVVLGLTAPREVRIVRGELLGQIGAEVRHAADARGRIAELLKPEA